MTRGTFICDSCEHPVHSAKVVPVEVKSSEGARYITLAFCKDCNRSEVIDAARATLLKQVKACEG